MNVRALIPWGRNSTAPNAYREEERSPFLSLHREVNRLFDDVFRSFDTQLPRFGSLSSFNGSWPNVEISETDKDVQVTAEIPGLDEKDVEVLLGDGVLTLKGDKQSQTEDKDRRFSERFYGHFERRIPLGVDVEEDRVEARFRNGVLHILLPKSEKAQSQIKRIAIKS
ncbi:Hsp20/alpha crystallin family protein [Nordella sp. HKS 07]|uniref:Hsp20/alpha crystallin family protein n=1 Tax=Nordella sp. HKS 07 TaxID=2712222 RepID=UPI0013E1D956|nr:Hsp20/alpha crystallin family protein [Nordella sp. HKS 07]QIG46789.1 Hsp20/alpha crystallin family protein [Nordella sp. HKS 07]